jgi:hypothetical protein
MKKMLLMMGLSALLTAPAMAWRPSGWVYFNWPYAYDQQWSDWYYFAQRDEQWVHHLTGSGGWRRLPQTVVATGWSWHTWPYLYSHASGGWYNFAAAKNQWCVHLHTGRWSIFGMPPPSDNMVVIPGGTKEGVDPGFRALPVGRAPFFLSPTPTSQGLWTERIRHAGGWGYTDLPAGGGKYANHPW